MTYEIFNNGEKIATLQTSAFGDTLEKLVCKNYGIAAIAVFAGYETNEEEGDYEEHEMLSILR